MFKEDSAHDCRGTKYNTFFLLDKTDWCAREWIQHNSYIFSGYKMLLFYGRYGDLTKQYEVPLSRMLHDILDDDHIQWHPPLIGHYTNFWPLLIWALLPNLTFYLIIQGFHRTYATGAACQQRTLTPPDTWSCLTLGLACVLMSRPISPELVLSPDFWISNTPRYFSTEAEKCHIKIFFISLLRETFS